MSEVMFRAAAIVGVVAVLIGGIGLATGDPVALGFAAGVAVLAVVLWVIARLGDPEQR